MTGLSKLLNTNFYAAFILAKGLISLMNESVSPLNTCWFDSSPTWRSNCTKRLFKRKLKWSFCFPRTQHSIYRTNAYDFALNKEIDSVQMYVWGTYETKKLMTNLVDFFRKIKTVLIFLVSDNSTRPIKTKTVQQTTSNSISTRHNAFFKRWHYCIG